MPADRLDIVGIPIDFVDMEAVIARAVDAAKAGRFFQIATVNLDFLVNGDRSEEVGALLRATAINMPDGAPVVWAARLARSRSVDRVAGADFVPLVVEAAARERLRVFFLGGENGAARVAADRLTQLHPDVDISVYEPPRAALDDMDDEQIMKRIDAAHPHILLVAFGHPKQDLWIRRNAGRLPVVAVGVGCSFDLIAGQQTRAPAWMQRIGLEWAYRLAHDPKRLLRRYTTDAMWMLTRLLPWALRERVRGARHVSAPEVRPEPRGRRAG